ncbi:MAG: hypothetical protein GEU99_00035 [Luteitalea sp.]|nr:hypothetical protein [Luteitalea sp.]
MIGLGTAIGGAVAIAAVSTLGDFIWATAIPQHRPLYGLTHGTLLLLCVGLYLGMRAHKPILGAWAGALIGLLAAASFYVLAPMAGYSAMFPSWIGLWVALGLVNGRVLHTQAGTREVLARGMAAAVASGIVFYAISGIWLPFRPRGWDYLLHFGAWTVAYLPGFAALLVTRRSV